MSTDAFDYEEMIGRQAGFVSADEQRRLRGASAFVAGVGGMGGVAAQVLARAGVGRLVIADIDTFETSNLNRQVYADSGSLGRQKAAVTAERLRAINPSLVIDVHGRDWTSALDRILSTCGVAINSMDDAAAALHLYRRAAVAGATVIDAYVSPLPNVTVVHAADPRPEDRLDFGTAGTPWDALTDTQRERCREAELTYVLVHSSSLRHIDAVVAADVIAGRRARPSYAPVVWMAGILMGFEALQYLLGRSSATDFRGLFHNPWTGRVERPRGPVASRLREYMVRRQLRRLMVKS